MSYADKEKVHVLKDASLGGVKREYVEVDMEADIGDYVHVTYFDDKSVSEIRKITKVDYDEYDTDIIDGYYLSEGIEGEDYFGCNIGDKCAVLEPTDIVIIGGKRYRIEERIADPGELIIRKKNGLTYDVVERKGDLVSTSESYDLLVVEEYVVIEPVEKSSEDIIANLVRRVAELERNDKKHREVIEELSLEISNIGRLYDGVFGEVTGIKRDVETWAQEVETLKNVKESKQITLDIDTLAKLIGGVRG